MSSEILRDTPQQSVAPVFWRVITDAPPQPEERPVAVPQQLEQKFQEGRQRGMSDAMAICRREAETQLQAALERLSQSITELACARQAVREETCAELVQLSLVIASRILHREVTVDPDAIHGLLNAAFEKTRSREVTRVLVHPAHEASVRRFIEKKASPSPIEIIADPRLECGAIRLETSVGQIDASLDTQLKEIERGLADRIGQ